jgi:N-acetylmuramic acid 6-phosphate etherase
VAPDDLDDLATEAGGDARAGYEDAPTEALVLQMNELDAGVATAVRGVAPAIALAIDAIADRLRAGGRLVYAGAGSSGRIGALDASECESTFSTEPGQVVALVAGGVTASPLEQEAAEDDREAGERDVAALDVGPADCVVGVSASGRTPYVLGAVAEAARRGSLTASVSCVRGSELARATEHRIEVVVGPEFLAGSTRLKAGTAQKLVLNAISTVTMIRLGKTYGSLMVDLNATNEKLNARVRRMVRVATGAAPDEVERALVASDGRAKVAIVSILTGLDAAGACAALTQADGAIADALGERT